MEHQNRTVEKAVKEHRFDDCCPYCEKKLDMYDVFVNKDYSIDFEFDCVFCGKRIDVTVHSVPEFELCKIKSARTNP